MGLTLIKKLGCIKLKTPFLVLAMLFVVLPTYAQITKSPIKTIQKDLFFKIDQLLKGSGDTLILQINHGANFGIKKGDQSKIFGRYTLEKPERSQVELGYCTVISTVGDTIKAIATIYNSKIEDKMVKVGDYTTFTMRMPLKTYSSVFYDLALLQINFLDLHKKSLCSVKRLLENDSKTLEDSLINICILDVKQIYNIIKDDNAYEALKTKFTTGRYTGRSTIDIMSTVNRNDLMSFLKHIKSYPGSYIGHDLKISDLFATWLTNNAPFNNEEILDSVRVYDKFPLKLKSFLIKNKTLIINDEYLRIWATNAKIFSDNGNDIEAEEILRLSEKIGLILADASGLGFCNYERAQIAETKEQYVKSIFFFNKALNLFKQANNYEYYFASKIELLYLQRMSLNFIAFQKTYNELKTDFEIYKSKLEPQIYSKYKGRFFEYYAHGLKKQGDVNEAIKAFKAAANEYSSIRNVIGDIEATSVNESIADLETTQNNYASANLIYDSLIVAYTKLNQILKKATVLDNKAYVLNMMGDFDKSIGILKSALVIQVKNNDWNNAGYSLSLIAQNLWSLGKLTEAIEAHKESIEYRNKVNNADGAGYSFTQLGNLYAEIGDKLKATNAFDSAKFYYNKVNAKDKLAVIEGYIGKLYLSEKNADKAIIYFTKAYGSLKSMGLKQEMATQLINLANATYKDKPLESAKYYQQAFEIYKETGIKGSMLYCLLNLGNIETRNKNFPNAENYFNQALLLSKEIKGKREEAITYSKLAEAAFTRLNLSDALLKYEQAFAIFKEIDEKAEQSSICISKGWVYIAQGKFDDAEKSYKNSLEIADLTKNNKAKADAFLSLSDLYQLRGEFTLAKQAIDSCFKIYQNLGNICQIANTHLIAGNYYNRISENRKAIEHYKIADSIYISEKEVDIRFTILNNIGTIYFYQGDYNQALVYFNQASKMLENQIGINDQKLLILSNIGEVYYHQKKYIEAEKYLLESMRYAGELNVIRSKSVTSLILGKLYYDKGDYAKSLINLTFAYNYAKSTRENGQLIESSLYLGRVALAQKKETEAGNYFDEAINNSDRVGDLKYVWEALYQKGLIFYNKNQLDSATTYFKQAISKLEKSATNLYGGETAKKIYSSDEKKVNLYNTLITALIKLGRTDEALEFTSKSNIEAIKEKLGQVGIQTTNAEKASVLKQQSQLAQKVTLVQGNLDKEQAKPLEEQNKDKIVRLQSVKNIAESEYLNFVDSIKTIYKDLGDNFQKTVNPEQLKNKNDRIPPDMAVILYVVQGNKLIAFTLTKETTKAKMIDISGAEFSSYIKDFSSTLKYPFKDKNAKPLTLRGVELTNTVESAKSLSQTGSYLYKYLIAPIKEDITGKTKLCIINNGELSSIPFQAIGYMDNKGIYKYLIEDYTIFYTNQLDIFFNNNPGLIKGLSFAAYGNPDKTLPSAELEVKEIHKIIADATVYIGNVATKDKAKESLMHSKIIHFATHGILDYNDYTKTFLKFAPSAENDGKLTIKDIKGLKINDCDLVTLSACETAVAQDLSKGWFVSPANSFLVNGVKTVVASLWSVDDGATSILMSSFYENLQTMQKAEALRKAQETLSHNPKYVHPFYWGAFILYGEWR